MELFKEMCGGCYNDWYGNDVYKFIYDVGMVKGIFFIQCYTGITDTVYRGLIGGKVLQIHILSWCWCWCWGEIIN